MLPTRNYTVEGMTCGHCSKSVIEEVLQVDGVKGVDVDLDSGRVTVAGESFAGRRGRQGHRRGGLHARLMSAGARVASFGALLVAIFALAAALAGRTLDPGHRADAAPHGGTPPAARHDAAPPAAPGRRRLRLVARRDDPHAGPPRSS